jgi:hypothetical protein
MSRAKVFIPSNFTVEDGASVKFKNVTIYDYDKSNPVTVNQYVDHFYEGRHLFQDCELYTEDDKIVFLDKLEASITGEEQLLL